MNVNDVTQSSKLEPGGEDAAGSGQVSGSVRGGGRERGDRDDGVDGAVADQ